MYDDNKRLQVVVVVAITSRTDRTEEYGDQATTTLRSLKS
jgi:hypothetical protein